MTLSVSFSLPQPCTASRPTAREGVMQNNATAGLSKVKIFMVRWHPQRKRIHLRNTQELKVRITDKLRLAVHAGTSASQVAKKTIGPQSSLQSNGISFFLIGWTKIRTTSLLKFQRKYWSSIVPGSTATERIASTCGFAS